MDFKSGATSQSAFPKGKELMSLKRISGLDGVKTATSKLSKNDFSGKGSYPESLAKYNECVSDAQATEYLFTRGTLKADMQKFQSDLSKLMYDKSIAASKIGEKVSDAANKYNKNLLAAKKNFVLTEAQKAVSDFNNQKYRKKIYYKTKYDEKLGREVTCCDDRGFPLYDHFDYYTISSSNDVGSLASQLHAYNGQKDVMGTVMRVNFNFSWMEQINQ